MREWLYEWVKAFAYAIVVLCLVSAAAIVGYLIAVILLVYL